VSLTGTPIGFQIRESKKSKDYSHIKTVIVPVMQINYDDKYGTLATSWCGRSSARETASRVVAGAVAANGWQVCRSMPANEQRGDCWTYHKELDFHNRKKNVVRCADAAFGRKACEDKIMQVRTGYHRWSSLVDSKCTSLIR
jgi:chorismate synthase